MRPAADPDAARFDTGTPAVVLKLDHNVFHHGGLGAIRSLGRLGIPVYGVHEDRLAPAAGSRYLHGRWFWRPDPERVDRLLAGLVQLAGRIGQRAVLLPTDDAGALLLAEHRLTLHRWFRLPAPPPDLPRRLAGKYSLYQLCRELDLPSVATALPDSWAAAEQFVAEVGLPVVAKLARPWEGGDRRHRPRSTTVVHGLPELAELYHRCGDGPTPALMLQEYIPAGEDWFFHGYCDGRSVCAPAFTGRKERSYPDRSGLTSLGRAVPNERLRATVTELLARLGYRGIMDLDLRRDSRDDRYKLLDFNPRLGAQFRLFQHADGLDVVRAAHLDLTGRPVPAGEPVADRRFLVENYDTFTALGQLRRRELGLRSWLGSLRGVDETAWFARDDLAPFGLMCLRTAWRAVTRPFARGTRPDGGDPRYRPGRSAGSAHPRPDAPTIPTPRGEPVQPVDPVPSAPPARLAEEGANP